MITKASVRHARRARQHIPSEEFPIIIIAEFSQTETGIPNERGAFGKVSSRYLRRRIARHLYLACLHSPGRRENKQLIIILVLKKSVSRKALHLLAGWPTYFFVTEVKFRSKLQKGIITERNNYRVSLSCCSGTTLQSKTGFFCNYSFL